MRICQVGLVLGLALLGACQEVNSPNLNDPSENDYTNITSRAQVQNLVLGLIAEDRGDIGTQILYGESMGRDGVRIFGAEPRFVNQLLGPNIDPSGFIGTALWPYDGIQLANIAVHGIDAADPSILSDQEKAASNGFIRTFKAMQYMRVAEMRGANGGPINTDIPLDSLAPISCSSDILKYVVALLDSAQADLQAGGAAFPFQLPSGFAGFTTPQTFLTFNRGLAAKAGIYLGFRDYAESGTVDQAALQAALEAVDASFINTSDPGSLDVGPMHTYSTISGDATNPLYEDSASTNFRVNTRVVTEADPGDERVARKIATSSTLEGIGMSSQYIYLLYMSNTSPISILTNKELILMKAEILWGLNQDPDALDLANFIRENDGGLAGVNITDHDALLTEILKQKRYSLLWQSSDRWVDARLFGRLVGEPPEGLGQERGFDPLSAIPIPQDEQNARETLTPVCSS